VVFYELTSGSSTVCPARPCVESAWKRIFPSRTELWHTLLPSPSASHSSMLGLNVGRSASPLNHQRAPASLGSSVEKTWWLWQAGHQIFQPCQPPCLFFTRSALATASTVPGHAK